VNRKNSKFLVRCNESGVIFKPFVFGSLVGNFEADAIAIMKRIGLAQCRKRGCKPSDCVRWLKGAISFGVMNTQANAIIRRGEMKEVLIYYIVLDGNKKILFDCHPQKNYFGLSCAIFHSTFVE
jgi:hypothetical protein